jgi:hypothetical protein
MLSHHHKTIFVHIPKCAGQSVETAFLFDLGLNWETRAPLLLRYNDMPQLGPPRLAHLVARDYVRYRYVPEEMFNSYYRFAIVRNPWSRTVALYRHLNFNMSFREFVNSWLADQLAKGETAERYWFVRPQAEFVQDGGKRLVNDIIRFENLNEEFGRVVAATGLKTALPHVNKSTDGRRQNSTGLGRISAVGALLRPSRREAHGDWKEFYRDDTVELVGSLYEADASGFGYSFDR